MYQALIPPSEPKHTETIRPPMVYVEKRFKWEYKQIIRNLKKENPPDEAELDQLGDAGWEMSGVAQQSPLANFYFKRLIER
jgi:hypothetical protein